MSRDPNDGMTDAERDAYEAGIRDYDAACAAGFADNPEAWAARQERGPDPRTDDNRGIPYGTCDWLRGDEAEIIRVGDTVISAQGTVGDVIEAHGEDGRVRVLTDGGQRRWLNRRGLRIVHRPEGVSP